MERRHVVYRAGLIPFYKDADGEIQMLFMQPSDTEYGGDAFQLAKGKLEDGEDAKTAAIREAREELGLFLGNVEVIREVGVFMGRTTVFVAKIRDPDMFGEPGVETAAVRWMSLDQFWSEGRELHRPVVDACHDLMIQVLADQ